VVLPIQSTNTRFHISSHPKFYIWFVPRILPLCNSGRAKSCCYVQQFPWVTALIKPLNFRAVDNRSYKIINGENKINFLSKAGFVYKVCKWSNTKIWHTQFFCRRHYFFYCRMAVVGSVRILVFIYNYLWNQ
jgi:hypothetical protein